ncbi:hypothetical protein CISIN_1g040891mg [Citrus sinensis]|uniref:Uncharacterized protein n=1 Tax=Citrus sinensis TaxID=2711 RepID=A0A067DBN6_CITSI|nr:hypothetical protein CISIN_1g040891mg [Citrus sinensis]
MRISVLMQEICMSQVHEIYSYPIFEIIFPLHVEICFRTVFETLHMYDPRLPYQDVNICNLCRIYHFLDLKASHCIVLS